MSMLGTLKQVAPPLLERLRADPALVGGVVHPPSPGGPPADDVAAFLSLLPGHLRATLGDMDPEMRAAFLAEAGNGSRSLTGVCATSTSTPRGATSPSCSGSAER